MQLAPVDKVRKCGRKHSRAPAAKRRQDELDYLVRAAASRYAPLTNASVFCKLRVELVKLVKRVLPQVDLPCRLLCRASHKLAVKREILVRVELYRALYLIGPDVTVKPGDPLDVAVKPVVILLHPSSPSLLRSGWATLLLQSSLLLLCQIFSVLPL